MARKKINLFDENGILTQEDLGADAVNVDIEPISGLESDNVQDALEELAGRESASVEFDDTPTQGSSKAVKSGGVYSALEGKQDKLTAGTNITISEQGVISAVSGGGSSIVLSSETEVTEIPIQLSKGWLNGNSTAMKAVIQDYHNPSSSGEAITDIITFSNMQGKYIFIPFGIVPNGNASRIYLRYTTMPQDPNNEGAYAASSGFASTNWYKPFFVVKIDSSTVMYRFAFLGQYASVAKVYVVTKGWLQRNGYVNNWAEKKWVMYGDSYVAGQGVSPTWHKIYSNENIVNYTNLGTGGQGLIKNASENIYHTVLSGLEGVGSENPAIMLDGNGDPLDVDIIGITCGRNDYSMGVPIGNIDDEITAVNASGSYTYVNADPSITQATFMGGLNYLCKWLIEHYKGKKIFFITPWYFLDDHSSTAVADPIDYVDAVLEVTGKWGIPCFDAARRSRISVQDLAFRTEYFIGSSDTSHLNNKGHAFMAHGPVAKWLENLFVD